MYRLHQSLQKDEHLLKKYDSIIHEQLQNGIVEKVNQKDDKQVSRETLRREVLKCDPRSTIHRIHAIHRSTDRSVISQGGRPIQDHQSQLDVGGVCDLFSFTIYFTICSSRRGQKEVIFAKTAQAYFCVLKMSNYTAACIMKAVSQLLPNYESRTWDA